MDQTIPREPHSKEALRNILNMKQTAFKVWIRSIEPELFKVDSTYGKYSKLLTRKAFLFLMSEFGYDDEKEVDKMVQYYYKSLKITQNDSP